MKKKKENGLDFIVDKLTNSIENVVTGEVFNTEITHLSIMDKGQINKAAWQFDRIKELKDSTRKVYKVITEHNPLIIQGLMSIEDKQDHIFLRLLERAKFNKGKNKIYKGVPGNLVAYACKVAMDEGYQGYVAFDAK